MTPIATATHWALPGTGRHGPTEGHSLKFGRAWGKAAAHMRGHERAVRACRQRAAPSPKGCAPRNAFIDAGVNWCNTLTLHRTLPNKWLEACANRAPWDVFGFEASRALHPYIERCTQSLSMGRELPMPPVPPAGSTKELRHFASQYGMGHCVNTTSLGTGNRSTFAKAYQFKRKFNRLSDACLDAALRDRLKALEVPRESVTDPALLKRRLASASRCGPPPVDTYTLIPAAVNDRDGTLSLSGDLGNLVRGGLHSGRGGTLKVAAVDLARWMQSHFTEDDFVVLKLDVEGAEHVVIPRLLELNAARLVDVLLWECHTLPGRTPCSQQGAKISAAMDGKFVVQEPYVFFNLTRLAGYQFY